MSLGARQLLTFLRKKSAGKGYCWWKQETLARQFDCGLRTVNRWVSELVKSGVLESRPHGRGNYYTVKDLHKKMAYLEKSVGIPKNGVAATPKMAYRKPPHLITEVLIPEEKQASLPELIDWVNAIPRSFTTPAGGKTPNPEFYRLRGVLESAEERIRRARNPDAYLRKILLDELAAASRLQETGGCVSLGGDGPKSAACGSLAESVPGRVMARSPIQPEMLRPEETQPTRKPPEPDVGFVREIEGAVRQLVMAKAVGR